MRQGEKRENGAFEWGLGIQTKSSFEDATAEIISVDSSGDAFKNGVQVVKNKINTNKKYKNHRRGSHPQKIAEIILFIKNR